jgi:transposase
MAALKDSYHRPKEPGIGDDAKAWVVHVACSKPKDLGYAAESGAGKHWQSIFANTPWRPTMLRCRGRPRRPCIGSSPNNRFILKKSSTTWSGDLPPVPGKHPKIGRDHEYERLGTCSILAALDLQDGHITARVEDRHRSVEFIGLLSDLDARYPQECTIRIILDNHSAHISKETQAFLSTRPNRFQYVLTPKHGSWLNIVETLFGKMARSFLRHIRVQSLDELKARILKGIAEINAAPVVHRWRNFKALEQD